VGTTIQFIIIYLFSAIVNRKYILFHHFWIILYTFWQTAQNLEAFFYVWSSNNFFSFYLQAVKNMVEYFCVGFVEFCCFDSFRTKK